MKSLRIFIDGGPLFRKIDGIGRYASELTAELARQRPESMIYIVGFMDDRGKKSLVETLPNVEYMYLPIHRRLYQLWFKKVKPLALDRALRIKPDVTIYFNFVKTPLLKTGKSILAIHDLAYTDEPETVSEKNRQFLSEFVPWSCERASSIITVSNFTAQRIHQKYGYDAKKIKVIPNGVPPFTQHDDIQLRTVRTKFNLPEQFLLFVGTIEPRKNLKNLLKAIELAKQEQINLPPLVLVGADGWNNDNEVSGLMQKLQADNSVMALGYVEDDERAAIVQMATIFVFPSQYEGFGIPLMEAMANRLPAVTSNREPMNSLAPPSMLRFNPESPDDILHATYELLKSPSLQEAVRKDGFEVAKKYTWANSAKLLSDEIERLTT
jgi:glycosyltransferase involved in cell wall biosynthesis